MYTKQQIQSDYNKL